MLLVTYSLYNLLTSIIDGSNIDGNGHGMTGNTLLVPSHPA